MSELLDESYLCWLARQVETSDKGRRHWTLLKKMYNTEFIWFVPNDDNRVADGLELRVEFVDILDAEVDSNWMNLGCSFLEMLIGLSKRLAFECEGEFRMWFWVLVKNLELHYFTDSYCRKAGREDRISEVLDNVIWRTYDQDGEGGLFPLQNSFGVDQREVEIWYQMNTYILERY